MNYIIMGIWGLGMLFVLTLTIYAIIDTIRIRLIEKHFESLGYKYDWIYDAEVGAYFRGFSKRNPYTYKIDKAVYWKELDGISLKEIKEKYQ